MRNIWALNILVGLTMSTPVYSQQQPGPSFFDWGDHYVRPSNPYVSAYFTITPDPVFWQSGEYSFIVLRFAYDPTCLDIEIANRDGQWISINAAIAANNGRVTGLILSRDYNVALRASPEGFMGGYFLNIFRDTNRQNPGKHIVELGILEGSSLLRGYFFGSIVGNEDESGEYRPIRWRVTNLTPGTTCCLVPAIGYSGGNGQMVGELRSPFGNPPDGCYGTFTVVPVRTPPPTRR